MHKHSARGGSKKKTVSSRQGSKAPVARESPRAPREAAALGGRANHSMALKQNKSVSFELDSADHNNQTNIVAPLQPSPEAGEAKKSKKKQKRGDKYLPPSKKPIKEVKPIEEK